MVGGGGGIYHALVSECFQRWLAPFYKDCEDLYTILNSPLCIGKVNVLECILEEFRFNVNIVSRYL